MFKQARFIKYGRWQRILLAAICISLASQVNFQIFTSGFILAFSPLIMPIFLYYNDDVNPFQLVLAVAFASPMFRGFQLLLTHNGTGTQILLHMLAEIAFYLCYGTLYYILYWRRGQRTNSAFFLSIIICDYLSNILEICLLTGFSQFSYRLFQVLFATALIRSVLACVLAFCYRYFSLLVRQESHEQKYYNFIWVAASVKSEVYFMQKNLTEIENVMKNAYLLNQKLHARGVGFEEEQKMALSIARDVHEVKKDYRNVISGLGDYFSEDESTMQLSDILKVVVGYIRETIKNQQADIVIEVHSQVDIVVPNHYYLVSILSNLIFNSVDALKDAHNGLIRLIVSDQGDNLLFSISDNGIGMDDKTQAMIFQPGFTTKFNENTGDVYRGIGLSHVRLIVQEQFQGDLKVCSELGKGTTFEVKLAKIRLVQEDIS
ncbi:GHKL domain-containing protein [Secundilactobacillus kimchicus]|uniref:sensor histidine kinase n=1 Tax=Secundilactobacillus kimchicus TaxID=528209 RepID=UPI000704DFEC|nr:ATP-binding protein [Secundilactobacillus kimchicus]MBT9671923.1 GHKL domain-containing protein [Secundilactobacillus kimchicus]